MSKIGTLKKEVLRLMADYELEKALIGIKAVSDGLDNLSDYVKTCSDFLFKLSELLDEHEEMANEIENEYHHRNMIELIEGLSTFYNDKQTQLDEFDAMDEIILDLQNILEELEGFQDEMKNIIHT